MTSLFITPSGCFPGVHLVPIRRGRRLSLGLGVPLDAITPSLQVGDPVVEYRRGMGRGSRRFYFSRVGQVDGRLAHLVSVCSLFVSLPFTAWRRTLDASPQDVVAWSVYADWLAERRHPRQERAVRRVAEVLGGHFAVEQTA